jgi:hypothetical protein
MTNDNLMTIALVKHDEPVSTTAQGLLGVGINSANSTVMFKALTVDDLDSTETKVVATEIIQLSSTHDLIKQTNASRGASLYGRSDYKAQFVQSVGPLKSTSIYLLLSIRVELKKSLATKVALSTPALNLLNQPAEFMRKYGDHFIRGVITGGEFFGVIEIDATRREYRRMAEPKVARTIGKFNLATELDARLSHIADLKINRCTLYRSGLVESPDYKFLASYAKHFPADIEESKGGEIVTETRDYSYAENYPSGTTVPNLTATAAILDKLEAFVIRGRSFESIAELALQRTDLFNPFVPGDVQAKRDGLKALNAANETEADGLLKDPVAYSGSGPAGDPDSFLPLPTFRENVQIPVVAWLERGGNERSGDGSSWVGSGVDGLVHKLSVTIAPAETELGLKMQICYVWDTHGPTYPWSELSDEYDASQVRHYQRGIKGFRLWLTGERKDFFTVTYEMQRSPNGEGYVGHDGEQVGDWGNLRSPQQYHHQMLCLKVSIRSRY